MPAFASHFTAHGTMPTPAPSAATPASTAAPGAIVPNASTATNKEKASRGPAPSITSSASTPAVAPIAMFAGNGAEAPPLQGAPSRSDIATGAVSRSAGVASLPQGPSHLGPSMTSANATGMTAGNITAGMPTPAGASLDTSEKLTTIRITDLTLEMARADAPAFKAAIQMFEDGLEVVWEYITHLDKGIKKHVKDVEATRASYNELSKIILPPKSLEAPRMLDDDFTFPAIRVMSEGMQSLSAFRDKFVDEMQESNRVLHNFYETDTKDVIQRKKIFERISERYETALTKYLASASRVRDASAVREDAFQLYDVRKSYLSTSFTYSARIIQYRADFETVIMQQLLNLIQAEHDYVTNCAEVAKGFDGRIHLLRGGFEERRAFFQSTLQLLNDKQQSLLSTTIAEAKPSSQLPSLPPMTGPASGLLVTPDGLNSGTLPTGQQTSNSTATHSIGGTIESSGSSANRGKSTSPIEKEGWLLKRRSKSMGSQPWQRRWFWIRKGKFGWDMQGKERGTIVSSEPMNVLLLHIRHPPSDLSITERRFIFEIISSSKTFLLQAESEDEVQNWITILTNARKHAVEQPSKWLDDEKRARDAAQRQSSMPGLPLPADASASSSDDVSAQGTKAGVPIFPNKDGAFSGQKSEDTAPVTDATSIDTNLTGNRRRAYTLLEESHKYRHSTTTTESNSSSSESLSQEVTDADTFKYTDRLLERKNDELHVVLPHYEASLDNRVAATRCEVQKDERLLDVFVCTLTRQRNANTAAHGDIDSAAKSIQGKFYVTQYGFYLYSNALSIVAWIPIRIKHIQDIQRGSDDKHIIVQTKTDTYLLKTILRSIPLIEEVLKSVLLARRGSQPSTFRQLYNAVDKIYNRVPLSERDHVTETTLECSVEDLAEEAELVPNDVILPSEPVACGCTDHGDRKTIDIILPIPAKMAFEALFRHTGAESWWLKAHTEAGDYNFEVPDWNVDKMRDVKYIIKLNNPMLRFTETESFEKHTLLQRKEHMYSLLLERTLTIDTLVNATYFFQFLVRMCFVAHANVTFIKSTMLRSVIQRAALKGIEEFAERLKNIALTDATALARSLKAKRGTEVGRHVGSTPGSKTGEGSARLTGTSEIATLPGKKSDQPGGKEGRLALITTSIIALLSSFCTVAKQLSCMLRSCMQQSLTASMSFPISVWVAFAILLTSWLAYFIFGPPALVPVLIEQQHQNHYSMSFLSATLFSPLVYMWQAGPFTGRKQLLFANERSKQTNATNMYHSILIKDISSLLQRKAPSRDAAWPTGVPSDPRLDEMFDANTSSQRITGSRSTIHYHLQANAGVALKLIEARQHIGQLRAHLLRLSDELITAEANVVEAHYLTWMIDDLARCWHHQQRSKGAKEGTRDGASDGRYSPPSTYSDASCLAQEAAFWKFARGSTDSASS